MLMVTLPLRSALLSATVGAGLVVATAVLGFGDAGKLGGAASGWGFLYALLPRTVDLAQQAGKLGEGGRMTLAGFLPTLAILAALLLILHVISRRSER